ncbi:oxidized purine nucleoside triphosphate hydrolase-like [Athalia rosae]|uniref:oxidized purine nucleoside triphosphate hydrolase-like n=1 Tax=Athalia rosae TaxID=37344 RepID=UPI0020336AE9|nr:oxidized purine nucleoside triphosphate hydrolase-like [Athalia rosae]XP_012258951.2 oxidized purine nucleoside triphosphate hydrolase-like [Athalia rosae]XP_048507757.1 oxidized purine nucleoside triphosphate hydrolase-like [Athalia rosae]XP_048507758.1 oxidized purine nucleoside triphosphate hydrolase-like [Athalia rosae]
MAAKQIFSLVFVRNKSDILIGMKKRGFGQGKWNGFGGKVESHETILQGAIRGLEEESSLKAENLKNVGILEFEFEGSPTPLEVHVFETFAYTGTIKESEDILPKWYNLKDVPFKNMWPDDELWFPYMLRGEFFKGKFLYRGEDTILKHNIEVVDKPSE